MIFSYCTVLESKCSLREASGSCDTFLGNTTWRCFRRIVLSVGRTACRVSAGSHVVTPSSRKMTLFYMRVSPNTPAFDASVTKNPAPSAFHLATLFFCQTVAIFVPGMMHECVSNAAVAQKFSQCKKCTVQKTLRSEKPAISRPFQHFVLQVYECVLKACVGAGEGRTALEIIRRQAAEPYEALPGGRRKSGGPPDRRCWCLAAEALGREGLVKEASKLCCV